jgi:hypothetical protein
MSKKALKARTVEQLRALPDVRLSLPAAHGDPAFQACLRESIETPELVAGFDRLYGANLVTRRAPIDAMIDKATGKQENDVRAFVAFVHDCIYLRLPSEAVHALRLANMPLLKQNTESPHHDRNTT